MHHAALEQIRHGGQPDVGVGVDVDPRSSCERLRADDVGVDERTNHATLAIREKTPHLAAADRSNPGIDAEFDG